MLTERLSNRIALGLMALAITISVGQAACARARHVAVVSAATYAQAVFALDDAEYNAWQAKTPQWTDADHANANPKLKRALEDVRAIGIALQNTPKGGMLPKSVPDLIQNLRDVEAIMKPLAPRPLPVGLATKATHALDVAIALLTTFTEVK